MDVNFIKRNENKCLHIYFKNQIMPTVPEAPVSIEELSESLFPTFKYVST